MVQSIEFTSDLPILGLETFDDLVGDALSASLTVPYSASHETSVGVGLDSQSFMQGQLELGQSGPLVGQVFAGYRILSAIQKGGMGELFLAEHVGTGDKVVLKRLLADYLDDERYVRMFRSEARVMSSLDHQNIVKVVDIPVVDGKQCLALEYVQGRNLSQIMRRCADLNTPLPAQAALLIICEALRGLDYAHNFVLSDGRPLGLVHRDVTPGNILVSFDGSVKITDFGISKSEMSSVSTTVGVVKGTTRYLSPEQIRGSPASPRSDLFSAAVVLVEALTGRALFDHGTVPPTLFAIVTGERPPIRELLPFEAPQLAAVLESALDLKPEARQASAAVLLQALEDARRRLGTPMDPASLGAFLRELFRDEENALDLSAEDGPWRLNAMELTYLFEVQQAEMGAFKPESHAPQKSDELERVRALLKAAVPGASPLDASEFGAAPPKLAADLLSHSAIPPDRPPTKLDRPPVAAEVDLFEDETQMVEPYMVEESSDAGLEETEAEEVIATDDILKLVAQPPIAEVAPTQIPAEPPKRRRVSGLLMLAAGIALGIGGWEVARPYVVQAPAAMAAPAEAAPVVAEDRVEEAEEVYPLGFASAVDRREALHEGPRRSLTLPRLAPGLLNIRRPRGARIKIDGQWVRQRVPVVGLEVAPGTHRIELFKRRWRQRYVIDVKPGERVDVSRR